jgi:hypothetical protein
MRRALLVDTVLMAHGDHASILAPGRLFVRSTNGRTAAWFRAAIASRLGGIRSGDQTFDVAFTEAAESDWAAVDAAYRRRTGGMRRSSTTWRRPAPRSATLEVHPG